MIRYPTLIIIACVMCSSFLGAMPKNESAKSRITAYIEQCADNGLSASILVAQNGEMLYSGGIGLRDKEKKLSVTTETVFTTGSLTKQFTATAILKLAEEDKLTVTDSISNFFANLPDDKKNITIHQLLTHSAGIIGNLGFGLDFQPIEKDTFLQEVFAAPLDFEPGSSYRYSNIGYSLLAIIIEQVTGQDYETCLHELLFQKAGMQQTGYLLPKWDDSQLAHGYKCGEDWGTHLQKWREDANQIAYHLKGNGGILSTPLDMYKWYLALKNNMIISQKSIEQLTYPYVKENEAGDSFYAYGWAIFTSDRDTKIVAHNGSNGVFYADFVQLPEEDAVIIYLTNQMRYDTPRVAWEIEKLLFDPTYEPIVPKMNTVPYAANDTSNSHLKVIRQFINLILKPVPGSDVDKFVRENVANEKRYNRFKMWVSDMQSGFVAHRLKHVLQYGDGSYDIMLESGDGKEIEMTPCFDLQFDENGKIAAFGW